MLSGKLLCLLLALTFSSSRNTGLQISYFGSKDKNYSLGCSGIYNCAQGFKPFHGISWNVISKGAVDVTVSSGDTAFLPCPLLFKYSDFTKISVKWEKDEVKEPSLCTYFINSNETLSISQCGRRFKVNTEPLGLNITDVESNDAGVYKCVMTKLIPPPTAENSSTLMLKVSALTLQLMNSTNSSCVELLCSLKGLRPQQVNFTWTRATQLLYHHESSSMRNTLTLCKPHWTDGETLTCQASYSNNHTLYSKSITLPCDSGSCNIGEGSWLTIIIIISTCAGLLLLILLGVAFFKCKERGAANGSIVYSNKIYENFTFSSATINTTSSSQNAQPGAGSNIRSTTTSNQQIIRQTQREECIYEN